MRKLPQFSVKNPVAVAMLFLAILMLGLVSSRMLRMDMLPEIEPPVVSILTSWYGASASDVESEVTRKIEDQVNNVSDLDQLVSKSFDGLSLVQCRFKWGTDLNVATNDIRDRLELARRELPEDVEPPMIFKFSSATAPIMIVTVTADKSWPRLYRIVDKKISDALKRVPGVGSIILYGGLRRRINVYFDLNRLQGYGIPLRVVNRVLSRENVNVPAGSIKVGMREYFVRVPARYRTVRDMENTIVVYVKGRPVFLRDVARVEDGYEPENLRGWGDGRKAVVMIIQKQSGRNTVEVARNIKRKFKEIVRDLPGDVKINIVRDTSEDIVESLKNLKNTLFIGIFLVVLVTVLFVRSLRAAFIVSVTIPFSLLISFILMLLKGYTINTISLMSLAIASGMVVDNAIVVLENIVRHIEEGGRPAASSVFGAGEMALAIVASTFTTVVVFLPLMFARGIVGIIFDQLGFIVTVTLLGSLLASLMLTPMLASRLIKGVAEKGVGLRERALRVVEEKYSELILWAVENPYKVLALSALVFLSSLSFLPFLSTSFLPEQDVGNVAVSFRLEEGTRIEETSKVIESIMREMGKVVRPGELEHSFAWCGRTKRGEASALGFEEGANAGEVGFKLVRREKRKRSAKEIADALRRRVSKIPGVVRMAVRAQDPITMILSGTMGKPIVVEIQGPDLDKITGFARRLASRMMGVAGLVDVGISQKDPRPEVWIRVDREKASSLGLTPGDVAIQLRNYFYGVEVSKFRDAGDFFDIFTRLTDRDKNRLSSLPDAPIFTPSGRVVKLKNIASIVRGYGPVEIDRKNRERIVKVEADKYGISLGEAKAAVERILKGMRIPPGITVSFGGNIYEQKKAFRDLRLMFAIGIALVYMVMASLFGNLKDPLIIMFSVPFALSGVFYAFYLTGTTLGVVSFMGIIMLLGIVVNNSIVLIDYVHLLRKRGLPLKDAVIQGGRKRLRPILMTTLTTLFGMLPLAVSRATGAEMWNPIGITMVSGLLLSTLVSLVLVPTIYFLKERGRP